MTLPGVFKPLGISPLGLSYARTTGMSESLVVYWGVSLICFGLQSPFWPIPVPPTETAPARNDDSVRIPLMADSDSIPIADSVPCDGGHVARVS